MAQIMEDLKSEIIGNYIYYITYIPYFHNKIGHLHKFKRNYYCNTC